MPAKQLSADKILTDCPDVLVKPGHVMLDVQKHRDIQ